MLNATKNLVMDAAKGVDARLMLRSGKLKRTPTIGWCKGEKQANIAILHKNIADDFAKFSSFNPGCLPILYQSKPGEKGCALGGDSDITTDLPGYKIYRNGEFEKIVDYATDIEWSGMVTFYIGCSFSFDDILMKNKIPVRNIEQNTNVSMYKTNIPCYTVGVFKCNMVVSMRPIPEHQLSLVADITSQMPDVHGAPVHIGDPDVITEFEGNFKSPDFGSFVPLQEGDVPVFWACGVTNSEAIKAAKQPLAITHCPGMMYLSDIPQEEYDANKPDAEKCQVVKYYDDGQRYSVLSVKTEKILTELENAVMEDPGDRGIKHLLVAGDFMKSALALSHASSIALITGFPVFDDLPYDETDGLPEVNSIPTPKSVYSLAAMLQALDKEVTLIVDSNGFEMNVQIMKKQVEAGILKKEIPVIPYIDEKGSKHALTNSNGKPKYDAILATERCGHAKDGKYYTMRAKDISAKLDPIDDLFYEATQRKDVITIGVGDGGNELGMGKVWDKVKEFIPLGDTIACDVAANLLVSAGTSNWGCHGLALALYELRRCQIHDRYYRRATGPSTDVEKELGWALPTADRERKNLEIVESFGIRDGRAHDQKMSVDGMLFDPTHAEKINELRKIISV